MAGSSIELRTTDPGFAKVQRDFDALDKQQQKLILSGSSVGRTYESMRRKMSTAGRAGKKTHTGMMTEVKSLALSYVSLTAAIGTATKALSALHDERKRAAEGVKGSAKGLESLATLAKSPEEMRRMTNAARMTAAEAGVSVERGAQLQFQLESLGLQDFRRDFAMMENLGQDSVAMAEAVSKVMKNFGEQDARKIVNQLLSAARESPAQASEIAQAVTKGAKIVGAGGGSVEEFMAAVAVGAETSASPDEAVTELNAFMTAAAKKGFQGKGLKGTLANLEKIIRQEGMSDEDVVKFLGRQEAVKGFRTLQQFAERNAQVEATVTRAGERSGKPMDELGRAGAVRDADERLRAERQARIDAELARQKNEELRGAEQLTRESAQSRIEREVAERNAGARLGAEWAGGAAMYVPGLDSAEQAAVAEAGAVAGGALQYGLDLRNVLMDLPKAVGDAVQHAMQNGFREE